MTDANETAKEEAIKIPDVLPVLPLKDLVIFPFIIVPLSVSREKSINAVDQALAVAPSLDPATLASWVAARHAQIDRAELCYVAHQLDVAGHAPAADAKRP